MTKTNLPMWVVYMLAIGAMAPVAAEPYARVDTTMGEFIVELYPSDAPETVANFMQYTNGGHYDRTLIHRVVHGYVVQGGGYSIYFNERPVRDPVSYEGDNGRKNIRGTLAMARGKSQDSAQAQWYINLSDNEDLDHKVIDDLPLYGYTVFGAVISGMDVVDAIGAVPTGPGGPFESEAPVEKVVINSVDIIDDALELSGAD
ncbi:MAG: peptidylprolyl isomerase [Pseudomonadota bacterium]